MNRLIEHFLWWLHHHHEWGCTGKAADNLGGEKYYWHIHECRWCDSTKTVLNAECEVFYDKT